MLENWQGPMANVAIAAFCILMWSHLQDRLPRRLRQFRGVLFCLVLCFGVASTMLTAASVAPGVIFDMRSAFIALSGLLGGPVCGLVVAAVGSAVRVMVGGAGTVGGVIGIWATAAVGIAAWHLSRGREVGARGMVLLTIAAIPANTVGVLLLPMDTLLQIMPQLGPSILLRAVGMLFAGFLLLNDRRRRRAERQNDLYRAVIEALPDCLNVKDRDGRFIVANPATARLMRAESSASLIGKTDFDFFPFDVAQTFRKDELGVEAAQGPVIIEQAVHFNEGETSWISTLKSPLYDAEGAYLGLVTHNRDITERKALIDELEVTRRRLDEALLHMADGLALYDPKGILLLCNQRYRDFLPKLADLLVPGTSYLTIVRAMVERGEQPAEGMSADEWAQHRLAELRSCETFLIRLTNGTILESRTRLTGDGNYLTVLSDVTIQRRAESARAASEARYRLLAENAADMIARVGLDGRLSFVSPASRELLGYEPEDLIGQPTTMLAFASDTGIVRAMAASLQRGHAAKDVEFRARRLDGSWVWVGVTGRLQDDSAGFVLVMRDITHQKRTEEALAEAARRLEMLASTDGLTNLATRRVFEQSLQREFLVACGEAAALSVLLIDVDRFKSYNDTYGHPAGDDCLRFVSQTLAGLVQGRGSLAARYGGEEIAVILPGIDAANAVVLAEKIRAAVRDLRISHSGSEHGLVTVSVGVASNDRGAASALDLVRDADAALYRAKHAGRDRVMAEAA